jgi:hypothetical protein
MVISYALISFKIKYLLTLWQVLLRLGTIAQGIQWESGLALTVLYTFLMDAKNALLYLEPNVEGLRLG